MKKICKAIIAAVLVASLLVAFAVGCKPKDDGDNETATFENGSDGNNSQFGNAGGNVFGIDFDAAFAAFSPETVMFTAGGYEVTWEQFFFYLYGNIINMEPSTARSFVWSDSAGGGLTQAQSVLQAAISDALQYKAAEYGAALRGVAATESDYLGMEAEYEFMVESVGSEEEFLKQMWEISGCASREMLIYILEINYLGSIIFDDLYGFYGVKVSDEDVEEFAAANGFMMAKHIVLTKPASEEDVARREIEGLLDQLDNYSGDDFDSFFTTLMREHSEDNAPAFPDGYLFQDGDLADQFHDACANLEVFEHSGIVETAAGYHIIYRIPLNLDIVPLGYLNEDTPLRLMAASSLFMDLTDEWANSLPIENTAALDSFDIAEVFAINRG